ncbi:hypothetical protein DID88_000440 [Monilinia fructigena]|uniref:Major facilitator superfamily (MFS) profile domain-containing protein n=1 Tax=Monilinia fructigena TaxID=38457 RepID=A0A395II01_9HELO|nr:hypothetical protein DID88_000440 [Monilinia fructigena]
MAIAEETGPTPREQHENSLSRIVSGIDQDDAQRRYDLETKDNQISLPNSSASSVSGSRQKVIHWEENDPENPYNWSPVWKGYILFVGVLVVINSTMGSSLPSNAIPYIASHFHITSEYAKVLPMSMYLLGYVLGPLVFCPLSEQYGRRTIMLATFFGYTVFTLGCALTPTWGGLLAFRILAGINASSPISVCGGVFRRYIQRSSDERPGHGDLFWGHLLFLPETYGPVLLLKRAKKLRKETGNPDVFCTHRTRKARRKTNDNRDTHSTMRMLFFELIVLAACSYLSLAYGIFYMYFEAYPIVFQGIYDQSSGLSGLMFLPIVGGAFLAIIVSLWWDAFLRKAQAANNLGH